MNKRGSIVRFSAEAQKRLDEIAAKMSKDSGIRYSRKNTCEILIKQAHDRLCTNPTKKGTQ